ncbi:hypothetical protein [Microvirga terrestris]|uniref:VCBS repeat-containing protein n=1 Tax=Microvirga terrestris TaxID=2791024 RepID=A0ABS0HTJ8_9HYPH|nr:hypothetical protein [Microvirga terrestris]MBF9196806.1 hypothetical protein [Microvirga terrestris]
MNRRAGLASYLTAILSCVAVAAAILLSPIAAAQSLTIPEVSYPSLPRQAGRAEGFVPPGWMLEVQASGDLNQDGKADLILVVRQNNPANVIEDFEGLGEKPFDTNPRILAIAFRDGGSGKFALQFENHTLIPRRTEPAADDPFDKELGIAVVRDGFQVRLDWFMSAGGWETFNTTYTFRHRSGRFELIGYDRSTTHRGSGDTSSLSVNYLTRKVKRTTGHISRDADKVRWQKLPQRPSPTLETIGDGLSFEPKQ